MRILIYDKTNNGHHWFYNNNVLDILKDKNKIVYCTETITIDQINALNKMGIETVLFKQKKDINLIFRVYNIFKIIVEMIGKSIQYNAESIMFLYFDSLILGSLPLILCKKNIIATLHWMPRSKIKIMILRMLSRKKNFLLVVHEELIKEDLHKNGLKIGNINVINYPINDSKDFVTNEQQIDCKLQNRNDYKNILCFGGTRYDKGLDILLDALNYVNNRVNLIVAGKEEHFTQKFIEEKFNKKHNLILNLKFINDRDVENYYRNADLLVLPYRKMFMGQSGPLTESIKYDCITIGPDWYIIGDTIKRYKCGVTFIPENSKSLAECIDYSIDNYDKLKETMVKGKQKFIKDRSLEEFKKQYLKVVSR